ncbi:MAG: DNA repair exonuclease [Planctomycetota bacterium]|nr:DNA repair exonuclease [Planctomycetota bacterium]
MTIRVLCIGDIHVGRTPRGLPEGLDARALGPAAAWEAFVRTAIEKHVDAAVLTGDVVDEDNRFFQAYSVLQSGLARLVEAGNAVFAVAGNHDADVLANLADQMPQVRLLGRGGQWEEAFLPGPDGARAARFIGWSFPGRSVPNNPLTGYCAPKRDSLPTIGLLHCDVNAAGSPYGPVTLADLKAQPVDAWLLGHIHKPAVLADTGPLILYPGSPQGLDPGEAGPHGAWLVCLETGQPPRAEMIPLAALRWEAIEVPLDDVAGEADFGPAVLAAMRAGHERIGPGLGPVRSVGCRLRLTGRTPIHARLAGLAENLPEELSTTFGGVPYFIETVLDDSRPALPLAPIAASGDPAGLLARRLVMLEERAPAGEYEEWIRQGRRAIERAGNEGAFVGLDADSQLTDERVRDLLTRAAWAMLEALLAQKEGPA